MSWNVRQSFLQCILGASKDMSCHDYCFSIPSKGCKNGKPVRRSISVLCIIESVAAISLGWSRRYMGIFTDCNLMSFAVQFDSIGTRSIVSAKSRVLATSVHIK